jgi:aminoglycoside N3'-acetyltransferase
VSDRRFTSLLDLLQVPEGGLTYVQLSTDWLERAGFAVSDVLQGLRDRVGPRGTLVMPVYPCRTSHLEYLRSEPVYDVRRTPSGLGLIPEIFRRAADVRRSLDPDFCIAAAGPDADAIVATDPSVEDPFGRPSVYERMIGRGATLLGLGVSLNTNSFIHVIDSRLESLYARPVYAGRFEVDVIDETGERRQVWRRAVAPEFQRLTQPAAVAAAWTGDPQAFSSTSIDTAIFFRWSLPAWAAWCDAHGRSACVTGNWPCWLEKVGQCADV